MVYFLYNQRRFKLTVFFYIDENGSKRVISIAVMLGIVNSLITDINYNNIFVNFLEPLLTPQTTILDIIQASPQCGCRNVSSEYQL